MKNILKSLFLVGSLSLLSATLTGCATNAATGKQNLMLVSSDEETKVATEAHERFSQSPGFYSNEALQAYVQQVGEKIVAGSDRKDIEYRFFVLDQPEVNALALPNGYIYVTRGLLAYLESESELAAVLAHEVAHVTARHSAQLMSSAKVAGAVSTVLGAIAGVAMGAATGDVNLAMSTMDATSGVSSLAGAMVLGNYSREHELEADQLGLRYLERASYSDQAMGDVIDMLKNIEQFDDQRLNKDKKRHLYHQFASHPELDVRLEKADRQSVVAQEQNGSALHEAYLQHTTGLVFEAFDEVSPAKNNPHNWLNKEALFQIYQPGDWKIIESTKETIVLEKSEDKLRTEFRLLPPQAEHDPEKFFGGEALGAKSIRDIWELNHIYHKKPKCPGFSAMAERQTADGTRPIYVAVLFHDKYTVLMTGIPEDVEWLEKHRYVFEAQANSTRLLTQEEYDKTRIKQIQTVKARSGDSYAKLAAQAPLGEAGESYLRLLNRQYPDGEPLEGQLIKVVVAEP